MSTNIAGPSTGSDTTAVERPTAQRMATRASPQKNRRKSKSKVELSRREQMVARVDGYKKRIAELEAAHAETEARLLEKEEADMRRLLDMIPREPEARNIGTVDGAFAAVQGVLKRRRREAESSKKLEKKALAQNIDMSQCLSELQQEVRALKDEKALDDLAMDSV